MSKSNNLKKLNKIKIKYCLILLILATFIGILYNFLPTFTRYYAEVFFNAIGYAKTEHEMTYSIHFDPNTGTGSMDDFQMTFNHPANLPENDFTKTGYLFLGWNTEATGTGTTYEDEQQVNNLVNVDNGSITLYAQWEETTGVAKVNGVYYQTLQAAINAVPNDNTETKVQVVADISENVTVNSGKKILLAAKGYTISNSNATPIIINNGYITVKNGTIAGNSSITQAAINNNQNATLIVTGGSITSSGTKQAIYNNQGFVEISGNAYLSNTAKERPVISNLGSSTLNINGGTIVPSKFYGVQNLANGILNMTGGTISSTAEKMALLNAGTATISGGTITCSFTTTLSNAGNLTVTGGKIVSTTGIAIINDKNSLSFNLGTKDSVANRNSPIIQGKTYGVASNTSSFNFYDGTIIGNTPLSSATLQNLNETEEGYTIITVPEMIDGIQYKSAHLGKTCTITFDPTLGTLSDDQINSTVEIGEKIAELPVPTSLTHTFDGWFTAENGGTQITENTIITQETIFYAHWHQEQVARINDTIYTTLQAAVNDVPTNGTLTTIVLLTDICENVEIKGTRNIQFDLQNYTITSAKDQAVFSNFGTIRISNGTIISSAATNAAINNKSNATTIMTGGTIIARGQRQALYNESGGHVEISGTAHLTSSAPERAAVHNLAGGHLTILGGTIISTSQQAVKNEGNLVLGLQDGTANENSPILQGTTFGLTNDNISLQGEHVVGTYSFYGGTVKGLTGAIDTNPANLETGYDVQNSTESGYEIARLVQHVDEPAPEPDSNPEPESEPDSTPEPEQNEP